MPLFVVGRGDRVTTALLPDVSTLAAEVRASSLSAVAAKYGANRGTIRDRIHAAGLTLPDSDQPRLVVPDNYTAPSWPDAACTRAPELFMPDVEHRVPGSLARAKNAARSATAICHACPHMAACLAKARQEQAPEGVWGSVWFHNGREMDLTVRRPRVKPQPAPKPQPIADARTHGTYYSYRRLRCRCDECRAANAARVQAERARGLPEGDHRHGTAYGYKNYGCRCEPCKDANTKKTAADRRLRAGRLTPDDPRHGTASAYKNWGCRCDPCREAGVADAMSRQRRRVA